MRTVTSSVRVAGGELPLVSVKTAREIPKGKIFAVMEEIHAAKAQALVCIGDVIVPNVADTGVDIVATRNIKNNKKSGAANFRWQRPNHYDTNLS